MRADLAQAHDAALAELLDHRSHQHPWAGQSGGWVLSRTAAGTFNLETMGRGHTRWGETGWHTTLAVVDVADRNGWPNDGEQEMAPPAEMLRTWAAQHGGTAAARQAHPQLAGDLLAADRAGRTGLVELGTVAALGLSARDHEGWAHTDVASALTGPVDENAKELAAQAYRRAIESAMPDQCWIAGTMVMGPPNTNLAEILDLAGHLAERIGLPEVLAEQGLWAPPPKEQFPVVRVEPRVDLPAKVGVVSELAEPETAAYWSVYGVRQDGLVDWSADFTDLGTTSSFVARWDRPIELRTASGAVTSDVGAVVAPAAARSPEVVDLRLAPIAGPNQSPADTAATAVVRTSAVLESARGNFAAADTARDGAFAAAAAAGHSIGQIAALAGVAPDVVSAGIERAAAAIPADTMSDRLQAGAAALAGRAAELAQTLTRPTVRPTSPTQHQHRGATARVARAAGPHL